MDPEQQKNITEHLISSCFAPIRKTVEEPNSRNSAPSLNASKDTGRLHTRITIMVIGSVFSGKSSLINRVMFDTFVDGHDETFHDEYTRTVTVSIRSPKNIVSELMLRYLGFHTRSKNWQNRASSSSHSHRTYSCDMNGPTFGNIEQLQKQIMEYDALQEGYDVSENEMSDHRASIESAVDESYEKNDEYDQKQSKAERMEWTEVEAVNVEVRIIDTTSRKELQTGTIKDDYFGAMAESDGYLLVFDASNTGSLTQLQTHFYQQLLFLSESAGDNALKSFHLVANKCDLKFESPVGQRTIIKDAEEFAQYFFIGEHPLDKTGIPFYETSAKLMDEKYYSPERLFKAVVTHTVERKLQRKLIEIMQNGRRRDSTIFGSKSESNVYDKFQQMSQRMSISSSASNQRHTMQLNSIRSMAKMVRDSGLTATDFQRRHSMKIPTGFFTICDESASGEPSIGLEDRISDQINAILGSKHKRPKNLLKSFKKLLKGQKNIINNNNNNNRI